MNTMLFYLNEGDDTLHLISPAQYGDLTDGLTAAQEIKDSPSNTYHRILVMAAWSV